MCSSRAECCRYTLHCCGQTEAAPVECHPWGGGRAQLERLASDHSGRATHATEPRYPRPGSSKLLFSKTAGEGVRRHLPTAHLGTGAVLTVLQLTTHLFLPTVLRWRHCWPHFTGKKSEALLHLFLHSPRIYSYAALTPLCRHPGHLYKFRPEHRTQLPLFWKENSRDRSSAKGPRAPNGKGQGVTSWQKGTP